MKMIAVDDEPLALDRLKEKLMAEYPNAQINAFDSVTEAQDHIAHNVVDIAFLDIQMGKISGMELACHIKARQPHCNIVFCTGYAEYAPEAFGIGASDYLLKPVTTEKLHHAMDNLRHPPEFRIPKEGIYVRCFGEFEVFWDGEPLKNMTKRAKELFAYLIDHNGGYCTTADIIAHVFGDRSDVNFRVGRKELEQILSSIGQADLVIRGWGKIGVAAEKIPCDLYAYINGNPEAVNLYKGTYMVGYAWAEGTRKMLKAL